MQQLQVKEDRLPNPASLFLLIELSCQWGGRGAQFCLLKIEKLLKVIISF